MTRRGSSKNVQKRNLKHIEATREALRKELRDLAELQAVCNKTREEKKEIAKKRKRIQHLRREIESKSELHSRSGKRH